MATVRTVEFPEMLGNFEHEAVALVARLQRIEDGGEVTFKLHVDDGADHLGDMSDSIGHEYSFFTSVPATGSRIRKIEPPLHPSQTIVEFDPFVRFE